MSTLRRWWKSKASRHATHVNTRRYTCERVMSHMWMRHVMCSLLFTCEYETILMWMCHVTHVNEFALVNESCHKCEWMSHVTNVNEFTHMSKRLYTCECVMSQAIEEQGIEACHTYECVMSHMWMSHVTNVNGSCHLWSIVHMFEETVLMWMGHVTHVNEFTHVNESCYTCEWVMSQMWMSHVMCSLLFTCVKRLYTCEWVM
jgi:hypothetical protein